MDPGDAGEAVDIVGQDRLFEPADVVFLKPRGEPDGLLGGVTVVGVYVDLDVVADRLTHRAEAAQVFPGPGTEVHSDLHLHAPHPAFDVAGLLLDKLLFGE